jgi:hypothetical protein
MSFSIPCNCDERHKPIEDRDWLITQYKSNRSAFNGYRVAASDYSEVICNKCRGIWRTKAAYVGQLNIRETL